MEEEGSMVESEKMHSEKYKGNILQIHLPANGYRGMTEMLITPTKCISRKNLASVS
jgi:hypothetical protein